MAKSSENYRLILNSNIPTTPVSGLNEITAQPISDQQPQISETTTKSYELPSELKSINFADTRLGDMLGKGSYGVLMKAEWNLGLDGMLKKAVAIKIMGTENADSVNREISMMHRLNHSNIVELFGYGSMPNGDHFIVMELMDGGSIDRVIHNKNITISIQQLMNWSVQIADGLAFIHDKGYIHRNLKPSNLLLSTDLRLLKIGDFGIVRDEFASLMTKQRIGTLIYIAPGVIFDQKYTSKCDVYSLGITLCEMYTRRRPYEGMKEEGLIDKIRNGLRPAMDDDEVDDGIRSIIKRCWDNDINQRPSMTEILRLMANYEINLKIVKLSENDLKAIAKDESRNETERMMALIRLANIWGNTIDIYQLLFISDTVYNSSYQLNSLDISQLSRSLANRSQLIDSIVIDKEKQCLDINWMYRYGLLLYRCFHPYSSRINNDNYSTEFDESILNRICQLVIEKMRLILCEKQYWINADWSSNHKIYIIFCFTDLLLAYRIKIDTADLQLLKQLFDQFKDTVDRQDPNGIKSRLQQLEHLQSTFI